MICSFEDMLKHALENDYKYAVLITEYCFDYKEGAPYIVYIPKMLKKLENMNSPLNVEHNYYYYQKEAAGFYMDKTSDNIIMFYTSEETGKFSIKNIEDVYFRWQDLLDIANEKNQNKRRIKSSP